MAFIRHITGNSDLLKYRKGNRGAPFLLRGLGTILSLPRASEVVLQDVAKATRNCLEMGEVGFCI